MYSPVHASVGMWLTRKTRHPVIAFVIGMASHYFLDAVPHGDSEVGPWIIREHVLQRVTMVELFDLGLAILIVWSVLRYQPRQLWPVLLAAGIGSITPDLLVWTRHIFLALDWTVPFVSSFLEWQARFHYFWHVNSHYDIPLLFGIGYQLAWIVWFLLWQLRQKPWARPNKGPDTHAADISRAQG